MKTKVKTKVELKFKYDKQRRSYGVWPKRKETEMTLSEVMALAEQLDDLLVIDSIDPDGTFHLVRYDYSDYYYNDYYDGMIF